MAALATAARRTVTSLPPHNFYPCKAPCVVRIGPAISSRPQIPVQNQALRFAVIHAVLDDPCTYPPGFTSPLEEAPVGRLENLSPIDTSCPFFPVAVPAQAPFWKPCTNPSPSRHRDLSPLSTLPPTTTTATRNIYPFTLFLRSILPGRISYSPTHPSHHHAKSPAVRAAPQDPHKMPPEIHRPLLSHEPPRTT